MSYTGTTVGAADNQESRTLMGNRRILSAPPRCLPRASFLAAEAV